MGVVVNLSLAPQWNDLLTWAGSADMCVCECVKIFSIHANENHSYFFLAFLFIKELIGGVFLKIDQLIIEHAIYPSG